MDSRGLIWHRDGLELELAGIDEPVDLVVHDWGGGHVVNAVMHRPELVRSRASDVVGLFDPDYVWHDLAQVRQTPTEGEQPISATACVRWVVDGDPSASGPSLRVDVRTLAPGDPTPF